MSRTILSTIPLTTDWVTRLLEDCENEGTINQLWNIIYLKEPGREMMWCICSVLRVPENGVPGQACRLLEQYMAMYFKKNRPSDEYSVEWEDFLDSLADEMPLLMSACILLAAKMSSVSAIVDLKEVCVALHEKNLHFSVSQLVNAEHKVFRTLGYRLPVWTSLEVAELLAVDIGLPLNSMFVLADAINIGEFYRNEIDARVQWASSLRHTSSSRGCGMSPTTITEYQRHRFCRLSGAMTLRTLHLAAGAVVATLYMTSCEIPGHRQKLARITHTTADYLNCIACCIRECTDRV